MAEIIGQLIEDVVRKQGWKMADFAEKINCSRENVYDLFKRSTIDVAQLQLISKVLNHNFLLDIIDNPGLVDITNPEVKKALLNRRAVAQFFEVMPTVLKNLSIETNIVIPIIFTVGERLLDRFTPTNKECFEVQTEVAFKNHIVDIWHNRVYNSWFADVKLDYKTEEEWGEIRAKRLLGNANAIRFEYDVEKDVMYVHRRHDAEQQDALRAEYREICAVVHDALVVLVYCAGHA